MHRDENTAMPGTAGDIGVRRASRVPPPLRDATQSRPCRLRPQSVQRAVMSVLMSLVLVLAAGSGTAVHGAPDPMVEAIQRALIERGFDPGKVDGAMGRRTRGTIRMFQRSVGLPDTGRADDATLTALGLKPPADAPAQADASAPQAESQGAGPTAAPDHDAPEAESQGAEPTAAPTGEAPETDPPRAEVSAPAASEDAPAANTPSPRPPAASDTDMPGTESPRGRTAQPSGAEESESGPAPATPDVEPSADASRTDSPKTQPAPKRIARPILKFATLGWHRPQTGEGALERFNASGAPRDFKRGTGSLFVPKSELVFVLNAGETIPGFDCDPGATRVSIEFVFGPDGPVIFNPVSGGEFCQMGIGIALEVGRTLEMQRVDWGDVQFPRGTVRITNEGLEYVK